MSNETNESGIISEDVKASMTGGIAQPMDTEAPDGEPKTALAKLKEELASKRNLDTGFEVSDFDFSQAIGMLLELDKFTQVSVFNSWKFFLTRQGIRQAMRLMPEGMEGLEKTADEREIYDQTLAKVMDDYEAEGDFAPTLPAFIALKEHLRVTMYDNMLEPSTMESTLDYMLQNAPVAGQFEKDYEARVAQGQRPGISKREFCEIQLEDALRQHRALSERGQAAIEFCNDLRVNEDRGWGDLPDWAVDTLYSKLTDKLANRWAKLDIRRTGLRTKPADRAEAEADQTLIEFVYEQLTGNKCVTEY